MAIYYMNVQIIGRSAGRSATGAAAYRTGQMIVDERTGQTYDYTRRRGEIETEIHAPAGAPAWVQDREQLWNAVEKAEKRGDAQVAREIVVAFPKELTKEHQRELIRAYVQEQFVSRGMVADVAIHRNPGNPHAHIMLTMREVGPEGLSPKKNREWNKPELLEQWREQWAAQANRALERAGREERIDHRSLAEQGTDRLPQVHMGPHAASLERRGVLTEKGDHNRLVAEHNAVVIDLEQARQERRQLQAEKVVMERYNARLKAGWIPDHAQALGKLEYRLDGIELKFADVSQLMEESRRKAYLLEQQVLGIRQEGERLDKAAAILGDRREAAAQVDRLRSPLASVKRWFSADARQEFVLATSRLKGLDDAAQQIGTTSETELEQQRERWQRDMARVPTLEEQAARHSNDRAVASKALEGFTRETERYLEIMRGGRGRSRDTGRDR